MGNPRPTFAERLRGLAGTAALVVVLGVLLAAMLAVAVVVLILIGISTLA